MAAEQQSVAMTPAQFQSMLEAVVTKMKEPTEAEKAKMAQEQQRLLKQAKEQADIARAEEQRKANRWYGCPHSQTYNGRLFHKWNGQVNTNGFVTPVCNLCHVEAPPFSAKLLPDEGKQGVNFEQWVKCDKELLSDLHKKSFTDGDCKRTDCIVCHPKRA